MPLTSSSGLLPSPKAVRSLSSSDIAKLMWATTNSHDFSGRQLKEDDKNESMDEVHSIGFRDTKYLPFRYSTAPLIDRTACRYTQELCARPLGDHLGNYDFAESMKAPKMALNRPREPDNSSHRESWRNFSREERLDTKQPLAFYSMAKTGTLNGMGNRMDQLSFAHTMHHGRSEKFCNSGTVPPPADNLKMGGRGGALGSTLRAGDGYRSRYGHDYWKFQYPEPLKPGTG
eukprot:TRINITY_DN58679_c0_g1_i1.p1 TRINITY_DN58679_c0_g1~~TRINITY_DN58679_c0_g1_i1.p1  ORF type:complete len:231 (+),score=30.56 TRINITY_DN58679_c0_g1_i1:77-769(+)